MISAHTHIETVLSASTLEKMIATAKELDRSHFVYTDFAYFISALKAYDLSTEGEVINSI